MLLTDALLGRRTIFHYEDRPVDDAILLRALEAARWAPNHKLTEPWRFTVLGPEARRALTPVAKRLGEKKAASLEGEAKARALQKAVSKIVDVPALLSVSYVRSPDDEFRDREDYAATCCALHNLTLSLWADGVGSQWSTGGVTRDDETKRILSLPDDEDIIGFVKIGYAQKVPPTRRRPLEEVVRRLP